MFASAFFLVACNEQQEDEGDITRDLYVYAIAFEDAGATEEESSAKVQADADSSADKTAIVYLTFQKRTGKSRVQMRFGTAKSARTASFILSRQSRFRLVPNRYLVPSKRAYHKKTLSKTRLNTTA